MKYFNVDNCFLREDVGTVAYVSLCPPSNSLPFHLRNAKTKNHKISMHML